MATYQFTTTDYPGATSTTIHAINDAGQFAGTFHGPSSGTSQYGNIYQGYLYSGGQYQIIPIPGSDTYVSGINATGTVVGWHFDSTRGNYQAYSFANGTVTYLNPPGTTGYVHATGVNASGQIVGYGQSGSGYNFAGFVDTAGQFATIAYPGATDTLPQAIDTAGDVVGTYINSTTNSAVHSFIESAGVYQSIDVPGATQTFVHALNDRGQVVGAYYDSSGTSHAFVESGGNYVTVTPAGSTYATLYGVNKTGQAVGDYQDSSGLYHAFVYDNGTTTDVSPQGYYDLYGLSINDQGVVAGYYATDSSYTYHGFLATPNGSAAAGNPTIQGTHASATAAEAPVNPFAGVTVADPNPGATNSLRITLSGGGGTLSGGAGFSANPDGSYALAATDAATLSSELDALTFTPANATPGATASTTFTLTDTSSAGTSTTDGNTVVTDTAAPSTPTPSPIPTPTPTPTPVAPDMVSLSREVDYARGVFTLHGTASSAAGVRSVEISAVLNDGTRQDLGAATLNGDGTFDFSDLIGPNSQSFFVATETDGAGGQATGAGAYALGGGLGRYGHVGQQTLYSPDGNTELAVANDSTYGQRFLNLQAPGQTVALRPFDVVAGHHQGGTTFVYAPAGAVGAADVIGGFKLGGADHDTLALPSSDFRNFAAVLRHTTYDGGGATITDTKTGDSILLRGVTEAALKAHPKDFAFA